MTSQQPSNPALCKTCGLPTIAKDGLCDDPCVSTNTAHTPTPWKVGTWKDVKGDKTVIKSGAIVIADIQWQLNDEEEANAAFIVRAVNNYSEMLEALKQAQGLIRGSEYAKGEVDWIVTNAINKAEGFSDCGQAHAEGK